MKTNKEEAMTSHHDVAARLRERANCWPAEKYSGPHKALDIEAADLLESQAKALSEATDEIQRRNFISAMSGPDAHEKAEIWHAQANDLAVKLDAAEARLAEIDRIVHVPTPSGEKADHHFQRDFDAIRKLTAPFRAFTNAAKEKT